MGIIRTLKDTLAVLTGKSVVTPVEIFPPPVRFQNMLRLHKDTITKIHKAISSSKSEEDIVQPLLNNFLQYVFDLPISKNSSDSLFSYSLRVAIHALENFGAYNWQMKTPEGIRDSVKTYQARGRWQLAIFISALVCNLGRIYEARVESVPVRLQEETEVWDPNQEGLYSFATRHERYNIKWISVPEEKFYSIFTIHFLHHIVGSDIIKLLGEEIFLKMMDSFSSAPQPDNHIASLLKEGNELARKETFAPQEVTSVVENTVQDFCQTIRSLYRDGSKKWRTPNVWLSNLYIGSDYTAVPIPDPLEQIRGKMKNSMPYDQLMKAMGQSGIILRQGQELTFRVTFAFPGGREETQQAVLVKNDVLWGSKRPALFRGNYEFHTKEPVEFVKEESHD